jgi:23S rRNA (pseudouridine1915-N3)-methyltransferase
MQLALVAVGALRPAFRELCDDYLRRLGRHARTGAPVVLVGGGGPGGRARRAEEGKRLRAALPDGAHIVALAREGKPWTSQQLAERMAQWQVMARPVAFVIGGSNGLDPEFIGAAHERWSLGPLTLPHELARVVIVEQLYRAFTILEGGPYHKGKG